MGIGRFQLVYILNKRKYVLKRILMSYVIYGFISYFSRVQEEMLFIVNMLLVFYKGDRSSVELLDIWKIIFLLLILNNFFEIFENLGLYI